VPLELVELPPLRDLGFDIMDDDIVANDLLQGARFIPTYAGRRAIPTQNAAHLHGPSITPVVLQRFAHRNRRIH